MKKIIKQAQYKTGYIQSSKRSTIGFTRLAGFSLIELMVVISIAGILSAIGVPHLQKTMQDNNMTALHNELLAALSFTRNTAITRGSSVTLCKANAAADGCAAVAASWENGWIVFADKDNDGVVDGGEEVLRVKNDLPENISITYSRNSSRVTYGAQGYAVGYNGNFMFCDKRGDSAKKGMVLSNNGRVRVASANDLGACPSGE